MSIRIETEKHVARCEKQRRIIGIDGVLRRNELPLRYRDIEKVWVRGSPDSPAIVFENSNIDTLVAGSSMTEGNFQHALSVLRVCGARLKEINCSVRELERTWNGREEFVI